MSDLSPKYWFESAIGADGTIIGRDATRTWLAALADSNDVMHLTTFGTSTEGNPLDAVFIGNSVANDSFTALAASRRAVVAGLLARTCSPESSLPIVLITSGIHATEIGGPQSIPELVHWLVTSDDHDATVIRESVLTIVVPTLNPDGLDLVKRWHDRTLDTALAGTSPPLLYHRFAGHDNNRDWLYRNLAETRAILDTIHKCWLPHVTLDQHQMNKHGPRFVLPPYADPWEPHIHPSIVAASTSLGQSIAADLTVKGMAGVMTGRYFDAWEPSRAIQHYRGGIRILAEAASANLALPIDVTEEQLRNPPLPQNLEPTVSCPKPWRGGRWSLRDIMDYHLEAAKSLLRHVSRDPCRWSTIQTDSLSSPTHAQLTFQIPFDREAIDVAANRRLTEVICDAGAEVTRGDRPRAACVSLDQSMSPLLSALLLPKDYPNHLGPSPYDVTTHHLPLLMGATLQVARGSDRSPDDGAVDHSHRFVTIDARCHAAPEAIEVAIGASPAAAWRAVKREFNGAAVVEPGTWIIDREALPDGVRFSIPTSGSLTTVPSSAAPVHRRDIILLDPGGTVSVDHGWTRWWLHARSIPFLECGIEAVDKLHEVARSTTVIIPDTERSSSCPVLIEAITNLASAGADVIAFGATGRMIAQGCAQAVTSVEFPAGGSIQAPGALVRLRVEENQSIGLGLDRVVPAMFQRDGKFVTDEQAGDVTVLAHYAARDTLVSGWMSDTGPLRDAPAIVRVAIGIGSLYAFAFRPLFRGQMLVTSPLVHNLLYHTMESEPCPHSAPEKTHEGSTSALTF